MINIDLDKSNCSGCTACVNKCPRNAISMKEDENGFKYPIINKQACINCSLCEKVCPNINIKENVKENFPIIYAAFNKNNDIRMKSSSGGMFTLFAEKILEKNGIVFGAIYNGNFVVEHTKAENIEELGKMRGSKYAQSNLNRIFKEVKIALENKRKVLFTGTPCQVEGLLSFLGKEYEDLYTQDIICHGVPSPKLLKKYLDYIEKTRGEKITDFTFRDKSKEGWNNYNLKFEFLNKKEYINHNSDPYMKLFLKDIALRESCYNCKFKKKNRLSDITLADFWGIMKVLPEMNDEKGTSALIINSKKGKDLFEEIKADIEYKETNIEEIIKYNPSFVESAKENKEREEFFKDLEKEDFEYLIEKYIK